MPISLSSLKHVCLLFTFVFLAFTALITQSPAQSSLGLPNFSAVDSHEVDTVNLLNNNILLTVPVMSKAGAFPLNFQLTANSDVFNSAGTWQPSMSFGVSTTTGAPLVDVIVVDREQRLPIGRPWLTLAIDIATRAVIGFNVSLEAPSALSISLVLSHAVMPKAA